MPRFLFGAIFCSNGCYRDSCKELPKFRKCLGCGAQFTQFNTAANAAALVISEKLVGLEYCSNSCKILHEELKSNEKAHKILAESLKNEPIKVEFDKETNKLNDAVLVSVGTGGIWFGTAPYFSSTTPHPYPLEKEPVVNFPSEENIEQKITKPKQETSHINNCVLEKPVNSNIRKIK